MLQHLIRLPGPRDSRFFMLLLNHIYVKWNSYKRKFHGTQNYFLLDKFLACTGTEGLIRAVGNLKYFCFEDVTRTRSFLYKFHYIFIPLVCDETVHEHTCHSSPRLGIESRTKSTLIGFSIPPPCNTSRLYILRTLPPSLLLFTCFIVFILNFMYLKEPFPGFLIYFHFINESSLC